MTNYTMPKRKAEAASRAESRVPGGFTGHEPQQDSPPPQIQKVSSSEVIATLRANGKGWSEDMAALLSLPQQLFMMKTESGTFYSSDERFGISGMLAPGPLRAQKGEYGIALYSTNGGKIYFVLADIGRRIIVRETLFSIHDEPPQKDWSGVKERIESALSSAAGEKEGVVILSDLGQVRRERITA